MPSEASERINSRGRRVGFVALYQTLTIVGFGSRLMEWTHPHFNGVTECARMKVS